MFPKGTIVFTALMLLSQSALCDPHRFAVIIGNNEGLDKAETLRYAERDAKKIYNVLTQLGRFKKQNTVLLMDKTSDEVWNALKRTEVLAKKKKKQTGRNTMLLVYYSGHAEGESLELSGTTLRFSKLRKFLEKSSVDVRLAFIDSCHSGQLISARGTARGPAFEIKVADAISSKGYAIITSSARNELSQESRELRGAYFTHHLSSALRGSADTSGDGIVTLQEAYKYAYSKTLSQTVQSLGSSQHPMYHFELKGRGEIVLTHTKKGQSNIEVPFFEDGRLLLLDGAGETILAEAELAADQTAWFSVPIGEYKLYIIKKSGVVRLAEFHAHKGTTRVGPDYFITTKLDRAVAKGGLFKLPEQKWSHRVGAGGIWRNGPLSGMYASYGGAAHYRLKHISGLQPVFKFSAATAPDVGVSIDYRDIGFYAGIGWVWKIYGLFFRTELTAGYEHMFQAPMNGQDRQTSGMGYLASTGIELPAGHLYFSLDAGAGGRIFQVIGKGWVHRLDFQSTLCIGWRWETR